MAELCHSLSTPLCNRVKKQKGGPEGSAIAFTGCALNAQQFPSGPDRHLEHAITLVAEQVVGVHDLIQTVVVRDQRPEIHPSPGQHSHQPARALPATRTQGGDARGVMARQAPQGVREGGSVGQNHALKKKKQRGGWAVQRTSEEAVKTRPVDQR